MCKFRNIYASQASLKLNKIIIEMQSISTGKTIKEGEDIELAIKKQKKKKQDKKTSTMYF